MDRIKDITAKLVETQTWPEFGAGDTVTVTIKIKEGNKERLQSFQGVVIQRKGTGTTETFTVRKMASGVGVERIFPISSPFIEKIEVRSAARASTTCVSALVSQPASRSVAPTKSPRAYASRTSVPDTKKPTFTGWLFSSPRALLRRPRFKRLTLARFAHSASRTQRTENP